MVRTLVLSRKDISPVGSPLRTSRPFALFSLLAALYLVVALSVPGAFLIARQASAVVSSLALERSSSSEQFAGNAGEEGGEHSSWHGPKRLRGALLMPKVAIDKIISSLTAPLAAPRFLLDEHAAQGKKLVVADEAQLLQDDAFPQELLGRSPPSSR